MRTLAHLAFILVLFLAATALGSPVEDGPGHGQVRSYSPCNCAHDTHALQAMLDGAAAANVREIQIGPGTLLITSPILLPSNLVLTLHPQTELLSTVSSDNDVTHSPIYAPATTIGEVTASLATAANIGDRSLSLAGTLAAAGQTVCMGSNNAIQCVDVSAVSGPSSSTLTLAEPLVMAFPSGTLIAPFMVPHDITINGNGALLTGTGTKGVEISKGQRVRVVDLRISGPFGIGISLDVGSRDSGLERIDSGTQGANNTIPISFEGCNRCWGQSLRAHDSGPTTGAIWIDHVVGFSLRDTSAWNAGVHGIMMTASARSGSIITGGHFKNNGSSGIYIDHSDGVILDGVTTGKQMGYGVYLGAGTDDITINNLRSIDDWGGAINVTSPGAFIINGLRTVWEHAGPPYYALYGVVVTAAADVTINGWTNSGGAYYGELRLAAPATVRVNGFRWAAGNPGWAGVLLDTGSDGAGVTLTSGTIALGSVVGSVGINAATASSVHLAHVNTTGAPTGSVGAHDMGTATWTYGSGVNLESAATPYSVTGAETTVSSSIGHP